MKTNNERVDYLSERYPCLYIFVLQKRGMDERLRAYDEMCQSYEYDKDPSKYSLYLHGHWLPYLQRLEEEGVLKKGKASS